MPASQKIEIEKLGIIAGGGILPFELVKQCKSTQIEPYAACFKGFTDKKLAEQCDHIWTRLGAVGKIIKYFKANNITDLVLIGNIQRPAWSDLYPDLKGAQILSRIGKATMGDSKLLDILKKELESEGFEIHPIQKFCKELLIPEGILGNTKPKELDQVNIELGIKISQQIGMLDIGQSVVVQNGIVLGIEAAEGTDVLIKRCATLQKKGRGAILVKTCKPQQDKALDLPTIGVETIENLAKSGYCGAVLHAKNVLLTDPKAIAEYADRYKIFIKAVAIDTDKTEVI